MAHERAQAEGPAYAAPTIAEAGIVTGVLAGIAMAAFLMLSYAQSGNALRPLQLVGATFYGPDALTGGIGAVTWGAILHLAISAAVGVVFAWIVGPYPRGAAALGWGITYALVVMFFMTYLILPWANPTMSIQVPQMPTAWALAHVVFGLCLTLAPGYIRRS
jgi:hypothetical protein